MEYVDVYAGRVNNLESLLADSPWRDSPDECQCNCRSTRSVEAYLAAKDAVSKPTDTQLYDTFYGPVLVKQLCRCGDTRHQIIILPLARSVYVARSSVRPFGRDFRFSMDSKYVRNPHKKKVVAMSATCLSESQPE